MIELPDGTLLIAAGEVIPCRCGRCGHLYAPPLASGTSECPDCGTWNDHSEQTCRFLKPAKGLGE